VLDCQCYHYS